MLECLKMPSRAVDILEKGQLLLQHQLHWRYQKRTQLSLQSLIFRWSCLNNFKQYYMLIKGLVMFWEKHCPILINITMTFHWRELSSGHLKGFCDFLFRYCTIMTKQLIWVLVIFFYIFFSLRSDKSVDFPINLTAMSFRQKVVLREWNSTKLPRVAPLLGCFVMNQENYPIILWSERVKRLRQTVLES